MNKNEPFDINISKSKSHRKGGNIKGRRKKKLSKQEKNKILYDNLGKLSTEKRNRK